MSVALSLRPAIRHAAPSVVPTQLPMACPGLLSHSLPPNSEGQGQNNLYVFNKTLKSIKPCPALFASPSPILARSQRSC